MGALEPSRVPGWCLVGAWAEPVPCCGLYISVSAVEAVGLRLGCLYHHLGDPLGTHRGPELRATLGLSWRLLTPARVSSALSTQALGTGWRQQACLSGRGPGSLHWCSRVQAVRGQTGDSAALPGLGGQTSS